MKKYWAMIVNSLQKVMCAAGAHDWRYASRRTKKDYESFAFCQRCEERLWVPKEEK